MLTLHNCSPDYKALTPDLGGNTLPPKVMWIDLLDATADEVAYVERAIKRHVPTKDELSEIENSSRLRSEQGALILSTPIVSHIKSGLPETTSLGLILTKDYLVTVRFTQLTAFAAFAEDLGQSSGGACRSIDAFAGLLDAIIDRAADVLENVGAELDGISQRVFSREDRKPKHRAPAREDASLRAVLRSIGYNGDLSSKIRDSLLGLARIVSYVVKSSGEWGAPDMQTHLDAQRHDIASLSDYEGHLANKVQLLLDATMGLINIEQNNIIKVLTVVSVVGVPPTLVASLYGMNFHNMPEYNWAWGYQYGLSMIVLSAVVPLLWFKIRGWL